MVEVPFWSNDSERIREAMNEIENLLDGMRKNGTPELITQLELKTAELMGKVNEISEKMLKKVENSEREKPSTWHSYSITNLMAHVIAVIIRSGKLETGLSMARNASQMMINKNDPIRAVDIFLSVGKGLLSKELFKPALAVFGAALNVADNEARVEYERWQDQTRHKPFDSENDLLYMCFRDLEKKRHDVMIWKLGCQICINQAASRKNLQALRDLQSTGGHDHELAASRILRILEKH